MKIVSMKQLRQKFGPIKKSLEKGESFLLMYRSKPLGVLRPYESEKDVHLLSPKKSQPKLPEQKPLQTLPEPKKIAIDDSKIPQLPAKNFEKPLNKFGLKKVFI